MCDVKLPSFIEEPTPQIFVTSRNYVVLDFETTNKDKGNARLSENRLVYCYARHYLDGKVYSESFSSALELKEYEDTLYEADFVVAHNCKFESRWMQRAGICVEKILFFDTMLAEYAISGNRHFELSLDDMCKKYLNTEKDKLVDSWMKNGVCPSIMPESLLQKRCKKDVIDTHRLFRKLVPILEDKGLLGVVYTKGLVAPVLGDMEMNGLYFDKELTLSMHSKILKEHTRIVEELNKFIGDANTSSPTQMAHLIYGKLGFKELSRRGKPIRNKPSKQFPDGLPKTDATTLHKLKATTKKQKEFIKLYVEESKLNTQLTRYFKLFVHACTNNDNLIFGTLNQAVTGTQRLSSSNPNLQNIDRGFKKVVTARNKGWLIQQNDYAQLEYRCAVMMANDIAGKEDIVQGVDAHAFSASIIFPDKWGNDNLSSKERSAIRTAAKEHTFKPLYGGTSGTKKEQEYYRAFLQKHSGITAMHDRWIHEVLETGKLVTPTGLAFYFPNVRVSSSGYIEGNQQVKNYPVQYLATGEIALIGTVMLWHCMKALKLQSFMVNTVHDSNINEVHPDEIKIMRNLTKHSMSNLVIDYLKKIYGIEYDVPLTVDIEVNSNWGYDK